MMWCGEKVLPGYPTILRLQFAFGGGVRKFSFSRLGGKCRGCLGGTRHNGPWAPEKGVLARIPLF